MATINRDDNQVPVIAGVLNTDGITPTRIKIDPSTHVLQVSDGATGSDLGNDIAARDDNGNPVLIATDASNNIIPLYVDSNGRLLIEA
jgi:hypothetical protein